VALTLGAFGLALIFPAGAFGPAALHFSRPGSFGPTTYPPAHNLTGLAFRGLTGHPYGFSQLDDPNAAWWAGAVMADAVWAITLRARWPPGLGGRKLQVRAGLIVAATLAINPATWYHHATMLGIPLAALVGQARRRPASWWVTLGLSYVAADFFINALFLLAWAGNKSNWQSRFRLGFVGGLAACVRYQNATLLLWPALEEAVRVRPGFRDGLARLGALGLGALVGFLPQLVVWRVVFGEWVVLNPYGLTGAGGFDLRSPHFLHVLFSTDRGLFPWMPLSALGALGLFGPLLRRRPALARLLGAQFLAQVYVVGSWSSWSGGAAFGPRLLVGLLPGLGLGLAALYDGWAHGRAAVPAGFSLGFAAFNLVLLARYGLGDVPHAGPVPLEHLWVGQLTFFLGLPGRLGPLLEALLRRAP